MSEFNLIDKPWIPCFDPYGERREYGISDTLLKAHELHEICDDSPLVTVAIHRMLLAILYRAFEGPSDMSRWKVLYKKGTLEAKGPVGEYLTKWHDRFFLFDDSHPFMQVAGLDLSEYKENGDVKKDKTDGLMRLAREAPDKGGRILFDHRVGTERPEYDPKEIAKMILAAQSYSGTGVASGGKVGKQQIKPTPCQFAPCVDGLCLWLQSENLFQTLMLNLVPCDVCAKDLPAWEDDRIVGSAIPSWKTPVDFTGPVQRFAPLSRFIRILDKGAMFFTNGLKANDASNDPMKAYARSDDSKPFTAVKLREDKATWRDAHALFSLDLRTRKPPLCLNHAARLFIDGTLSRASPPKVNVVGLATDQGKALLWRHDRMPLPVGILSSNDLMERLGLLIAEAERVGAELSNGLFWSATNRKTIRSEPVGRIQAIADLLLAPSLELRGPGIVRTSLGRAPEEAHNKSALDLSESVDPRPAYWARLEEHFFDLLERLPNDWDQANANWKHGDQQTATRIWRDHVEQEAKRALEESIRSLGMTARAIQAVARVRTDFNDGDLKALPTTAKPAGKAKARGKGGKNK
jgi:CRISPR system Cascade subunit CasA